MKKKGGLYVVRGQFLESEYPKIHLFDGKYTTGFKIVDFVVCAADPTDAAEDCHAKLSTEEKTSSTWNWEDVEEIAWASSENRVANAPSFGRSIIDPDNLVIEDLYLRGNTSGDAAINYMITMQKYEFKSWDGAAVLVKNKSQAA